MPRATIPALEARIKQLEEELASQRSANAWQRQELAAKDTRMLLAAQALGFTTPELKQAEREAIAADTVTAVTERTMQSGVQEPPPGVAELLRHNQQERS